MEDNKKYEEALERAKDCLKDGGISKKEIFPELKESEDERIRKEILDCFRTMKRQGCFPSKHKEQYDSWIAWLEKQGQVKYSAISQHENITSKENDNSLTYEDERIRKAISQCVEDMRGQFEKLYSVHHKDSIAWLEKQGEQKSTDKVEPKFKVGDWVVYTGYLLKDSGKEIYVMQVASVEDDRYNFTDTSTLCFDSEKDMRSWTIQDAKDGDVLVNQNGEMPFIFKKCKDNHIYCYCGYTNRKDIFFDRFVNSKGEELHWLNLYYEQVYPAAKEQRDLLFAKMKEAGYEWDAEKKELRKIKQKIIDKPKFKVKYAGSEYNVFETKDIAGVTFYGIEDEPNHIDYVKADNCEIISGYGIKESGLSFPTKPVMFSEQKPVWSKKDEKIYQSIMDDTVQENQLNGKQTDWLRDIKYRYFPQPKQEMSEEDEDYINDLIKYFSQNEKLENTKEDIVIWLKSLIERYTWKPSDEQMAILWDVIGDLKHDNYKFVCVLQKLYNDLKKLREAYDRV